MARKTRYTVFDVMEERGVFDANPANASSPLYKGPIPYPKMLYHPAGETRVIQKSEKIRQPWGFETSAEQREIINRVVQNAEEEQEWLDQGWHDHPAKAIAAGGGQAPATFTDEDVRRTELEIALLQAKLKGMQKPPAPPARRETVKPATA